MSGTLSVKNKIFKQKVLKCNKKNEKEWLTQIILWTNISDYN